MRDLSRKREAAFTLRRDSDTRLAPGPVVFEAYVHVGTGPLFPRVRQPLTTFRAVPS
jgi:hypothetical protein